MPVPLSRTRKRASNVNRSCSQVAREAQTGVPGMPAACRFYNVGGIYSVGARSRFVRNAIKKRTQMCCNCEGVHFSGDIARRRTSALPCNSREDNLEEYEASNESVSTQNVIISPSAGLGNLDEGEIEEEVVVEEEETFPAVTQFTMEDTVLESGESTLVTLKFSEAVFEFNSDVDITAPNGELSQMTSSDGGVTWIGTFTPDENVNDDTNKLVLASGSYINGDGNEGPEAQTLNYTVSCSGNCTYEYNLSMHSMLDAFILQNPGQTNNAHIARGGSQYSDAIDLNQTLSIGDKIQLTSLLSDSLHPVTFSSAANNDSDNILSSEEVTTNDDGTICFTPTSSTPGTVYIVCTEHDTSRERIAVIWASQGLKELPAVAEVIEEVVEEPDEKPLEETKVKHSDETVENDERVIIIDNSGDTSFTIEEVEYNKSQNLPYKIGFIASQEDAAILTESGINAIRHARNILESMITRTTGYIRDGVDLKIRIMLADLGTSESSGTTLAQSVILKLAQSVYGDDKAYFPIEGAIWINTSALPDLLNERMILNNTNLPKLCSTMLHEMLHILCIGIHPNRNFGWGSSKLGLVTDMTSKGAGWLYTGKSNSKAVSFYRDIYCKNENVMGIPIEDDDGFLGHFEEGYDNEGNFGIRIIDGVEYYPLPFEIMSTYHTNISFTSPITLGILEDYGYEINWNNEEIVAATNIQVERANQLNGKSLGKAVSEYFS